MEEGECSSSSDFEINQLRGRLDRRNALLDIIRKAYHRDVLVVKEHLQKQGTTINANDNLLIDDLSSVPSIDLRETFRLFAPHECELRVRPCFSCGGQLEIIHRESARIVDFKYAIKVLQEREEELRLELVGAEVEAQKDRQCLVDVVEKSKDEREVLLGQILSLKHQVADRNALEVEVQQLKAEKSILESTIKEQKPILLDHERLLVEIEQVKDDRNQWQAQFHEQVEKNSLLQSEKDTLRNDFDLLKDANKQLQSNLNEVRKQYNQSTDQCTTLTNDLLKSQTETMEAEDFLYKAEQAIDELETNLQNEKEQHQSQINDLESKCLELQSTITELERISQKNLTEALYYRRKIDATLQGAKRRGSIAIVPSNRDAVLAKTDELIRECDTLRHKTTMLFNLLLGCIRTTYENCLVQEKLLVDNGSELYRNSQQLKSSSSEPTNEQARTVLNHLDNADESDTIDWISILKDETDQRHIMGNLQNRLQIGQFSLDKAFQKVYKSHEAEVLKHQAENDAKIEQRRLRIWELEQMLTDAISLNRKYEGKMTTMREKYETVEPQLDSIKAILRKMRRECVCNNTLTSQLKDDYVKMKTFVNRLLTDIKSANEEIQAQRADLADKHEDITNRDAAITQLETLLERITHRYAENEKKRIKITHEVATQAIPTVVNTATHADFLPTPLGSSASVAVNDVENRKPRGGGSDALLPGRIYKLSDENESWPSRISIPAKRTSLSFRRLIDKL